MALLRYDVVDVFTTDGAYTGSPLAVVHGGSVLTADQMHRRGDALRLLDGAIRRALVAACNSAFDPVP